MSRTTLTIKTNDKEDRRISRWNPIQLESVEESGDNAVIALRCGWNLVITRHDVQIFSSESSVLPICTYRLPDKREVAE